MIWWVSLKPHPHPHSHRIRGYLCSFSITWTPPPEPLPPSRGGGGERYRPTHYLRYWLPLTIPKKIPPLSRAFLGNLPENYAQKIPFLSRENGTMHAAPYAFELGGRGGGGFTAVCMNACHFKLLIVIPGSCISQTGVYMYMYQRCQPSRFHREAPENSPQLPPLRSPS